jgi:hypothetical protein
MAALAAAIVFLGDKATIPAQQRIGRHYCLDLRERLASELLRGDCEIANPRD